MAKRKQPVEVTVMTRSTRGRGELGGIWELRGGI